MSVGKCISCDREIFGKKNGLWCIVCTTHKFITNSSQNLSSNTIDNILLNHRTEIEELQELLKHHKEAVTLLEVYRLGTKQKTMM